MSNLTQPDPEKLAALFLIIKDIDPSQALSVDALYARDLIADFFAAAVTGDDYGIANKLTDRLLRILAQRKYKIVTTNG